MSLLRFSLNIILSILAPILFCFVQMSFLFTINKLIANYNREKYSILPFLLLFLNCFDWFIYGIETKDVTICVANSLGLLLGFLGTIIYYEYSMFPPPTIYFVSLFLILFITLCFYALRWMDLLGFFCMCFAIALYASPLTTLYTVLQDRSTESIPFAFSLIAWVSAIVWLLYGVYAVGDIWISIASIIGIVFTSFQLILFGVYGLNPNETFATTANSFLRYFCLDLFLTVPCFVSLIVSQLYCRNM
jgi:solute carrier family 50 protein (sugar transporter)